VETNQIGRRQEMKVEIDLDLADEITTANLKRVLKSLREDYKNRKAGKKIAIFDTDKVRDLAELNLHIYAFKLVMKYYGVKI
jgi:hypothetical protein